jgi:hypothetical protein
LQARKSVTIVLLTNIRKASSNYQFPLIVDTEADMGNFFLKFGRLQMRPRGCFLNFNLSRLKTKHQSNVSIHVQQSILLVPF